VAAGVLERAGTHLVASVQGVATPEAAIETIGAWAYPAISLAA
jgi:hypothetical protein